MSCVELLTNARTIGYTIIDGETGSQSPHDTIDEFIPQVNEKVALFPPAKSISGQPVEHSPIAEHMKVRSFLDKARSWKSMTVRTLKAGQFTQDASQYDPHQQSGLLGLAGAFQFLVFGPVALLFLGQPALLLVSSLNQTPVDGNSVVPIYLAVTVFSVALLLPSATFLRLIPRPAIAIIAAIFLLSSVHILTTFPFSERSPFRVYWQQQVDLDAGTHKITLTGIDPYVREVASYIPSAHGAPLQCGTPEKASWNLLTACSWPGPAANVVSNISTLLPVTRLPAEAPDYADWFTFTAKRTSESEASFYIAPRNSGACKINFDQPVTDYDIEGSSAHTTILPKLPEVSTHQLRLWRRQWGQPWSVRVRWGNAASAHSKSSTDKITGTITCSWSDANEQGTIPAFDEMMHFMPTWTSFAKASDGLVEGSKSFVIE